MKQATSKEKILKKVRTALIQKTEMPFPNIETNKSVYPQPSDPLDILFAEEFNRVEGKFLFCESQNALIENLKTLSEQNQWEHLFCWDETLQGFFAKHDFRKCRIGKNLEKAQVGITRCESLIARTGSILLSTGLASGRSLSIFPPVHIVIAYTSDLVYDLKDGIKKLSEKYGEDLPSMINMATGPSRTADIEKTLVLGAHGPKEVYVFLIDQEIK